MSTPLVTIVVPSFNQGRFLNDALVSIFQQKIPVEVFVMDGGSSDNSLEVIRNWEPRIAGWRSYRDNGQADAINEGIALGRAPYVCWLNSDDWFLPDGLVTMVKALDALPNVPAVYCRSWNVIEDSGRRYPVWVEPFCEYRLALRCIISQPATLIRRTAWEIVGGVNPNLHMAMDYDLWWCIYKSVNPLHFIDKYVAVNRVHASTKTNRNRRLHYEEAISVVRKYYGRVPWKWWLAQPYSVWWKFLAEKFH